MKTVFILISMLFPVAVMAQKSVKISDDISITQLSDKVYTYVSLAEIEGWGMVPSNGMIVINNHQAALLDTPINDAQTETLVNWVTDSLHAEVTTFIPNHWHGDCIGGLGYLQRKGVQSYANQMTIDLAKEKGLPVPEHGFTDSLTVSLDGMPLQCYYLGGGHATDNIVVWLPTENILFGGCMLKDNQATSIGNISDADVTAWPKTLDKVKAKFPSARYVVPGHGDYGGT